MNNIPLPSQITVAPHQVAQETAPSRPKLIVTRGVSNSGKSTWARGVIQNSGGKIQRVNRDSIREELLSLGLFEEILYQDWQEKMVTEMQEIRVPAFLNYNLSVIVDGMNLSPKDVRKWQKVASKCGADFEVKEFAITLEEALERAAKRPLSEGPRVPEDAIRIMFEKRLLNGKLRPM